MWEKKGLKKGAIVDIIAPGRAISNEEMVKIQKTLEKYELSARALTGPHALSSEIIFCSNTDEYRWNHLYDALYNEESSIIWACAGGYGSSRLLTRLLSIIAPPIIQKVFIGFSDITALNIALNQKWGWNTIHGTLLSHATDKDKDPANINLLMSVIFNELDTITITDLTPLNKSAQREDISIHSNVTGGNLSLIQTSIGTSWQLISKDKILFLEDVGEKSYRIDRMLEHLMQAGIFNDIKALVFGTFTDCILSYGEYVGASLNRIAEQLDKRNIPVFQTNKIGHGYSNYPIIYGANAKIYNNKASDLYNLDVIVPNK